MRRINITRNNNRKTKSFLNIKELAHYIFYNCHSIFADDVAKDIWDLNVGTSLIENGYEFSIQSKRRTGNKMINNTRIGERI
tara:strand:+ start:1549 stop:1794 length:246 start_codon:yes stop_codon:yes gene_type:complete